MGDKGGINNYNSYKLKAEDLTRPWAIGPANIYIYLIAPRIPPGQAGLRDEEIVAIVLESLGDPVTCTCRWSCFGCHLGASGGALGVSLGRSAYDR